MAMEEWLVEYQPSSYETQPGSSDPQPGSSDPQPGSSDPQPGSSSDFQPTASNPKMKALFNGQMQIIEVLKRNMHVFKHYPQATQIIIDRLERVIDLMLNGIC